MTVKIIISHADDVASRAVIRKVIESVYGAEFFGAQQRTQSVSNEMPAHVTHNVTSGTPPALGGVIPPNDSPEAGEAFVATSGEWPKLINGQQIDSEGTPYSKDIHSDPPVVTTKGVWRGRRGVDKTMAAKRAAELRALIAGQVPALAPAVQQQPPAPTIPAPSAAPAPAPTLPPLLQPAPAPAAAPLPEYVQLMENLGPYMQSAANPNGLMTDADVAAILQQQGLSQITDLQYSQPHLTKFAELFNNAYGAKWHAAQGK